MKNKSMVLGLVLLSVGVFSALSTLKVLPGQGFLFILTIGFLAAYAFYGKNLGFLIPGCVLASIAVHATVQTWLPHLDGSFFLIMLGLAFAAVFVIHTARCNADNWGAKYWPLFPAGSLILIGALVLSVRQNVLDFNLEYLNFLTPAILLIAGLIVLIKGAARSKNS